MKHQAHGIALSRGVSPIHCRQEFIFLPPRSERAHELKTNALRESGVFAIAIRHEPRAPFLLRPVARDRRGLLRYCLSVRPQFEKACIVRK
jgi:hypothetical protein